LKDVDSITAQRVPKRADEMTNPAPVVGQWYRRASGETFEVVATDPADGTIEIQYFDGAVEELDVDEWHGDRIVAQEAPEDWTGSVDVEPEDYENEVEAGPGNGNALRDPLQCVDRNEAGGYAEFDLSEADAADESELF
jgi:hypothetical protein